MTRSQQYAIERSKDRGIPFVIHDQAEVAMVMHDPSILPVLGERRLKGWEHVRTIEFEPLAADAIDAQLLTLVETTDATYGFGIVRIEENKLEVGIYVQAPTDAEVVEEVFQGEQRARVTL